MSSPKKEKQISPPRSFGWMAEYEDDTQLLDACRKVRDAGYTRTDAFAPFPVHGIDEALGIKPTVLPWITLFCGLSGLSGALLMEWWMNAVSYPYIISGKPFFSLPAFIPVMFECTILFSAFSTVIGMILLNGLPKFSNPVFTNPRFDRATDDRFFLWVDSRDKYFNADKVKVLLESTHPASLDVVKEDESSDHIPSFLWKTIAAIMLIGLVPGSMVLRMRAANSEDPRWHVFFDMDFQPKKKYQQTTSLFADGRASRPPVEGTMARGDLGTSDPYLLGYTPEPLALDGSSTTVRMVSLTEATQEPAKDEPKVEEAKKDDPKPEEKPASDDKPVEEKPAEVKPADDKPAEEKKPEEKKPEEKPADDKPAENKPVDDKKPADDKPAQEKPPEPAKPEAKTDAKPADVKPADSAQPAAAQPATEPEKQWVTDLPIDSEDAAKMMELGKRKFNTICAACHGLPGDGSGLVAKRANELAQGFWVPPTSLHDPDVQKQPVGKIFNTITNGKGKMGAYGNVLSAKERWAVVLYVRALQLSRDAKEDALTEDDIKKLTAARTSK